MKLIGKLFCQKDPTANVYIDSKGIIRLEEAANRIGSKLGYKKVEMYSNSMTFPDNGRVYFRGHITRKDGSQDNMVFYLIPVKSVSQMELRYNTVFDF